MKRSTWKGIAQISMALLLLVGGGAVWLHETSAAAVTSFPSVGQLNSCPVVRDPVISVNGGPDVQTVSTGAIQVVAGKTSVGSDGRLIADLTVKSTRTDGSAAGFGSLVITTDPSRPAPPSSLASNSAESAFPATSVIRFYPLVTLNGETFRLSTSAGPATLVNTSVSAYPAPKGTVYVLTNALTLRSSAGNSVTVKPGRAVTIQ